MNHIKTHINRSKTIIVAGLGACAGLAGLASTGGVCSGSCPSCFGCAAAGAGVIVAALYGRFSRKDKHKEAPDGLA